MSHTYATTVVHCVFSTKHRAPLIPEDRREKLWAYFLGVARNLNIKILAIGGVSDHLHVLLSLPPARNLAKVMCDLKANSSRWMNETGKPFAWQEGYAAFSVSPGRIAAVQHYIHHQKEHHHERSFEQEFVDLLKGAGVPYDPEHIFG